MDDKLLGGKWEMAVGSVLIPASLLGDITPNYAEGLYEVETQAGTRKQPNGKAETAEMTFTLYLPSIDYLKVLFSEAYNAPSGTQKTGNIIFGSNSCSTISPLPINLHPVCEDNDNNDIHIYAGLINASFNPSLTTGEVASIETTIYMQPTANGYIRLGTGDTTQESHYDVASQTTKPGKIVESES